MKLCVIGESLHDEVILRAVAEAVLSEPIDLVPSLVTRPGGFDAVRKLLPAIVRSVYYRQLDVQGLIVVVDSDFSWLTAEEVPPESASNQRRPRLPVIHRTLQRALGQLNPVEHRPPLKVAIGLAVPAIEAWLCAADHPQVSEQTWRNGLRAGRCSYTPPGLKTWAYGHDRPSRLEREQAANQFAATVAGGITNLQNRFPLGFGNLIQELERWRA